MPGSRLAALAALALLVFAAGAASAQDPARTPTIYVHGYEAEGAGLHGVFGVELRIPQLDSIAALAGLPVADSGAAFLPANVVTATSYYGDTPPASWTPAQVATLDSITAVWGGGVPRYAFIVATYVRDVLRRTHADRVNLVTASFGSLLARWMIEKDVGGLAGEGRIARWLTIEGVLAGNWAASRGELVNVLDQIQPQPVDVDHMAYDWVTANLHAPRGEADDPNYARVLIGEIASTNDGYNHGALSDLMRTYDAFEANDGVQAVADAVFSTVTPQSRFQNLPPTRSYFPTDHLAMRNHRGAWAAAALFVTQRRRVTVTLTSARVTNLHEPDQPWWDWRPAEVVFENRVYSPRVLAWWGITDALSERSIASAAAPLYRFARAGDALALNQVLFDGFVPDDESMLRLELGAHEVDYDWRYGVYETAQSPYFDDLGSGTLQVSALAPGTYAFAAASWTGEVRVDVVDYPFDVTTGVPAPAGSGIAALRLAPNPHAGGVTVRVEGVRAHPGDAAWRLEIFDTAGRRVRTLGGDAVRGIRWDGRDDRGIALPAGVYRHRLAGAGGVWRGTSLLLR